MIELDFSRGWLTECAADNEPATLAVDELNRILPRITGWDWHAECQENDAGVQFILIQDEGPDDGFLWQAEAAGRVELRGHSARGLLYAVYSFLEALGCHWLGPGAAGERLPQGQIFSVPETVAETPALPGRCLIIGHQAFMQEAEEWVVWAGRNRLNTIFLHVSEEKLPLGASPEKQWQTKKANVLPLTQARGMIIEHGGHGLPGLLPRDLFKSMPEAFRFYNGERRPDYNFCPHNAEGLAVIRHNAEAHFRAHPEATVFHLWPDDIPGGGWCECEQCREYTPSEQALLAVNTVAEVLAEVNPRAQISFLAYHDTEETPHKVQPRANVCLLWAPRKRCYAHPTDDKDCALNYPFYPDTFRKQGQYFRENGAQPARVFEYYLDAILFKSVLPPLPTVLQQDLRFYQEAGAHTVQALMTGDRPWLAPQLNAWLFARLAWNPRQDGQALVEEFCASAFGKIDGEMAAYYRALEKAFAIALEIEPGQIHLEFDINNPLKLLENPPADMGDPVYASDASLARRAETSIRQDALTAEAGKHFLAARAKANEAAWQAEAIEWALTREWLRFDARRMRLYSALANQLSTAPRCLAEAQIALEAVLHWGDNYLAQELYRINFRVMHVLMWQLRLWKIESDLAGSQRRLAIRTKALAQMGWLIQKLIRAFAAQP